ncbi:MAG TPA: ATP-dependent Clp protease ATP-binding subunit ClpX, partial [Clostridia bacterium]|nr:ATP-dependent Clp protease ATP-binding subunit ClpX [Clostridia bacterium]
EQEALVQVAKKAIDRKTGARGLRAILEDVMMQIMYDIPSRTDVKRCVITKDVIDKLTPPVLMLNSTQHKQLAKGEVG